MARDNDIRLGEKAVAAPADAELVFIGRIRTPWKDRMDCPRQGRLDGPLCRIEIFEPWIEALAGIERYAHLEILYWLHLSRRDLVLQSPKSDGQVRGTFALRSPVRPNPIATSMVKLIGVEGAELIVQGLDCLDGTPLIDVKPDRCDFTPAAPRAPGDIDVA